MSSPRPIEPGSPAARYLEHRRRATDPTAATVDRLHHHACANHMALRFGYAATQELDAQLDAEKAAR